jgi:hypothetical protein
VIPTKGRQARLNLVHGGTRAPKKWRSWLEALVKQKAAGRAAS